MFVDDLFANLNKPLPLLEAIHGWPQRLMTSTGHLKEMHGEVLALRKSLPPYFFGTNFLAMLLGNLANMVGHLKSGSAFTQKLVECVVSYPLKVVTEVKALAKGALSTIAPSVVVYDEYGEEVDHHLNTKQFEPLFRLVETEGKKCGRVVGNFTRDNLSPEVAETVVRVSTFFDAIPAAGRDIISSVESMKEVAGKLHQLYDLAGSDELEDTTKGLRQVHHFIYCILYVIMVNMDDQGPSSGTSFYIIMVHME